VETQTNGQLAAQFAVVARKQDEIVERLESTESRVAVIAAHVDVLVATATPKPIRPSRAKKES
jgi:gamma-glutamyl-gamma-aminobutyrate hydrolase PuuD